MRSRLIACAMLRGAACLAWLATDVELARAQVPAGAELQREQREQIDQWRRQAQRPADLPQAAWSETWSPPIADEKPCVVLKSVQIVVAPQPAADPVPSPPWRLTEAPADYLGVCLGMRSLQRLTANLQGRVHALGYVTSTLTLPEQDLSSGVLRFDLRWGRVGRVHIESPAGAPQANAKPASNALALSPGAVLNLRDIEHTLENLSRLPSQTARFVIEPGSEAGVSDLRILVDPEPRWRGNLAVDSADIRPQRPWDLQAQMWLDAPLGLSDQWMLSASGSPEATGEQRVLRHSLYTQWSVPWGRHLVTLSASTSRNSRDIPGGVGRFIEHGEESQHALRWQTALWRGADWRTQWWASWTARHGRSFVGDVELLSRRREADELGTGLSHWHRLPCGEASLELEGNHTVRLARVPDFQDLQAPKPRQWRVQLDMHCAWAPSTSAAEPQAGVVPWTLALSAWTQAVERPFDGTDLLSLGGRYNVRGHGPEQMVQGRRISVLRLTATAPGQVTAMGLTWQPWMAWDAGRLERAINGAAEPVPQPRARQAAVAGVRWQVGRMSGELAWARAIGPSPAPRLSLWQAQAAWRF